MTDIHYQLAQPDRTVAEGDSWGVILPAGDVNLTVISERAPSLIRLDAGMLQIVDEKGEIQKRFFVKEGIATVANDVCVVASENIIPFGDISIDEALQKAKDDAFYQTIVDCLSSVKNR